MQFRPYKRFAYPISVIPEGQGGTSPLSRIFMNEACQTCRDDLLVRNPLRAFAVQEMCNRSLGWTRVNIWGGVHISKKVMEERSTYFVENIDGHFREHPQFDLFAAFPLRFVLGGPGAFHATRLVWLKVRFFVFIAAINRRGVPICSLTRFSRLSS